MNLTDVTIGGIGVDTPIKVLHLIDNLKVGGAQEIILSLVRYSERQYKHTVVCLYGSGPFSRELENEGAEVLSLAASKYSLFQIRRRLADVVSAVNPDLVNLHLQYATILGLWWRRLFDECRVVVTLHALKEQLPRWFYPVFTKLVHKADQIVVEDKIALSQVRATGYLEGRIEHIPIGTDYLETIETLDVQKGRIRKEFGIPPDAKVLLNVARMHPAKGQSELLHVVAKLLSERTECWLIVVGYGPEECRLKILTEQLGVDNRVVFPGLRRDLHDFYIDADCFLMTALDEGMGVVIYQAMAFGLPVVAYDAGSIREVVADGETGFLVPVGDRDRLYLQIKKLLTTHQVQLDAIGNCARDIVKNEFSAEKMTKSYSTIYKRVSKQ